MLTLRMTPSHFHTVALLRRCGNFALLRNRHADGYIVSMHQAGTHWLKFMLANALAEHYALPPPSYNHANDIIGGPKDTVSYRHIPRILSSHSLPHPLLHYPAVHKQFKLPRYVLLVRDLRSSLVSNFAKWQASYGVDFSVYLQGCPFGKRFNADIWWNFEFLNAWSDVRRRCHTEVLLIRYEDLQSDTLAQMRRVAEHLRLPFSDECMINAVGASTKEAMARRHDPARPEGEIRESGRPAGSYFDPSDRNVFSDLCARFLRNHFGYDFSRWESPDNSS
ncbi:MAG: sulfotransferase domain-containing protein [Pseudomonadota bacterium]